MTKEKDSIYLDNNATTPLSKEVLDAMIETYALGPLNPSSQHTPGHKAKRLLLHAREEIAQHFKVPTDAIIFLGCATEGINQFFQTFSTGRVLSTKVEHASLYECTKNHPNTDYVTISQDGSIDLSEIEQGITEETSLLLFSYANSETGTLFPIDEIAKIALKHAIPLVIDGVGALGKTEIHIPDGVTGMIFSGHKIHGPPGSAFMYVRPGTKLYPLLKGGGQERGIRSGTESVALAVGLAKAVSLLKKTQHEEMHRLREYFESSLKNDVPEIVILGGSRRVANVSTIAFPGIDAESLLIRLDMLGVYASHGSACAAGALEPSRALLEMGIPLPLVRSAIRFSFSRYTTLEEIKKALSFIVQAVNEQKAFIPS